MALWRVLDYTKLNADIAKIIFDLGFDWRKRGDSLRTLFLFACYRSTPLILLSFVLFLCRYHAGVANNRFIGCLVGSFSLETQALFYEPTSNPFESPFGNVKIKRTGKNLPVRFVWRKRGDSNPWAREDYTISNRARYDHFDTLPYYVFILKLCRDFYRQLFYFICFLFKCQLFFKRFIKLFKVFWFFAPLHQLLRFPCSAYYDINHLQNKLRYDIIRYGEIYGSHCI